MFENKFSKLFLILLITTLFFIWIINYRYSSKLFNNTKNIVDKSNDSLFKYKIIHENIMMGLSKPIKLSVNGPTQTGYANKLYSVITSLVVAVLTDSAFLVRWENIDSYIREPFYKSFHNFSNENNEFNIDYDSESVLTVNAKYPTIKIKDIDNLTKTRIDDKFNRFVCKSIYLTFFEICSNPDYEKLYQYGLVSYETKNKAFEVTQNMGNYSDKDKKHYIFKVPYEVGGNLLNKVWVPKDFIMNKINYYVNNVFKDYFVIGIQIRNQFIDFNKDFKLFIECAQQIESNLITNKYKGIKWFISSDLESIADILREKYPNKIVTGDGVIGHISKNKDSYQRAILDHELLSRCDELIITGGSTFGKN